jgi:hypothetical protein
MGETEMKLDLQALTASAAIVWALALLLTGLAGMLWPGYGAGFLSTLATVYPGYDATGSFGDLIVGTLYALVDGAVFGAVLGWLYNRFRSSPSG